LPPKYHASHEPRWARTDVPVRDRVVETASELHRVFGARLQSHASFPLAHEALGQTLQFLVAERLEVDRVERDRSGGFLGHRTLLWLGNG
jgi:hypothetical protein